VVERRADAFRFGAVERRARLIDDVPPQDQTLVDGRDRRVRPATVASFWSTAAR
jgi:hypothetical protein